MVQTVNKKFYARAYLYFFIALLVTVVAFWPSYFARLTETGASHHVHGLSALMWMLILVIQPLLYKLGKMNWHRNLGRSTILWVPIVIISGLIMVHFMLNDPRYPGNLAYQLGFIDFFVLSQFLLFYILALKNVSNIQYHARYMVCTIFGPLIPALTRLLLAHVSWIDSFNKSLHSSYILVEVVLILLILDDKRRGKIYLPYLLALGLMAIQHLMMHFAGDWIWWQWLMDLYSGS